ncbi:MAG: hypothetical protein IH985_02125 [Planctomycetes bacterium]|nr:hypothetical protein [Planctomycetota bacterium]
MTSEKLVELADAETAARMLDLARRGGFESVQAVLDRFEGKMADESFDEFNRRLNSGGQDAVEAFSGLVERVKASDAAAAQEGSIGFGSQPEFVEASEKAADARASGLPDRDLELRISATSDVIIAGRDPGGIE